MAYSKFNTQLDPYQEMENYLEKVAVSMLVKKILYVWSHRIKLPDSWLNWDLNKLQNNLLNMFSNNKNNIANETALKSVVSQRQKSSQIAARATADTTRWRRALRGKRCLLNKKVNLLSIRVLIIIIITLSSSTIVQCQFTR